MKTLFTLFVIALAWQISAAQTSMTADFSAVHNYTWRFYNYKGPYAQSFFNLSWEKTNWNFSLWSNFGLESQTNLLEFAPYLAYQWEIDHQNSLAGGLTYYFVSPEIDSSRVLNSNTNTGEIYLSYYHNGSVLFSVRNFFDPFLLTYYGVTDLEKTLFPLGKGDVGGFVQGGVQFGNKGFKEGFSNGMVAAKWARTFRRTVTCTLMSGLSYLGTGDQFLFQNKVVISF